MTFFNNLLLTLKIYSLTLVIPITLTILIIVATILGIETNITFFSALKIIWIKYYINGIIGEFIAWRIHLSLYFIVLLFSIFLNE